MNLEFIAQPDRRVGDTITDAIQKHGVPRELIIVSAFASLTTILRFKPSVEAVKSVGGEVRLVLGVDLGGTSREVLSEVATWGVPVIIVKNRKFGVTFHPKIYLMRWADRARLIVGSNNLTEGGLFRNYEAATQISFDLPADQSAWNGASAQLQRFLAPTGPVAHALTPDFLAVLLSLPEIPSESTARRKRGEGIPKIPSPPVFGYEPVPPAPKHPNTPIPRPAQRSVATPTAPARSQTSHADVLVIQLRLHHNGELLLSKKAALQNPTFFKWPFAGKAVPKKKGNPPYPQLVPDPIVDLTVFGEESAPVLTRTGFAVNTVYYESKKEIRITVSPLLQVMGRNALMVMVMRASDLPGRDYELVIHRPDSPEYQNWLDLCDQLMPGGGKVPRRFGWL